MKLLWTTDLHGNFLYSRERIREYIRWQQQYNCPIIITGDIGEASSTKKLLRELQENYKNKVYFVYGNHDFYGSSIEFIHNETPAWTTEDLVWVSNSDLIELDKETVLLGTDGWYDAQYGKGMTSRFILNDFSSIQELISCFDKYSLLDQCWKISRKMTRAVKPKLLDAVCKYNKIIFVTHVPPWDGSAWHNGTMSEPDALPWFTNKTLGDLLDEFAVNYPSKSFIILAGHSHSPGIYNVHPNMVCHTGKAKYGRLEPSGIFDVDTFSVMHMYNNIPVKNAQP